MFSYMKHIIHVLILYTWLAWYFHDFLPWMSFSCLSWEINIESILHNNTIPSTQDVPSPVTDKLDNIHSGFFWNLFRYIVLIIDYLVILPLPQVFCNLLGLTFFNTFPDEIVKEEIPLKKETNSNGECKFLKLQQPEDGDHSYNNKRSNGLKNVASMPEAFQLPHLCFRVVTRGSFPDLVKNNVHKNYLTCLESGLVNFSVEIVTDHDIYLVNSPNDNRIKQLLVPKDYRSSTGALFKARALQYALEPGVSNVKAGDYIVHLDEETIITKNVINGICNFALDGRYAFGQGLITYYNLDIVNIFTTLADSYRVADDMGKLRFQLAVLHRPIFGWKGSFVVTRYEAELDVSFDHGPNGSIAEDCYFSMVAMEKGYKFDFILGEMLEKSPFTVCDFIKQRRRWVQGIWLVVHNRKISIRTKFFLIMSHYACLTLPLITVSIGQFFALPASIIVQLVRRFCVAVTVYMYLFGLIKSYDVRPKSVPTLVLHLILQILTFAFNVMSENVAVIWGIFSSKYNFHVVNKDIEGKVILDS